MPDLLATVATLAPMLVAAVICGLIALPVAITDALGLGDADLRVPAALEILGYATLAVPVVAALGGAILVGPSVDLVGFIRAVIGVLAGIGTWFVASTISMPSWPVESYVKFSDGGVLRGDPADAFLEANPGAEIWNTQPPAVQVGRGRVAGWKPSPMDNTRFAVVRIGGLLASVVVSVLVADWSW